MISFQFRIQSNLGPITFSSFASLRAVIGRENLRHPRPVKCKTRTNQDSITRVFPRFNLTFRWFFIKFISSSDWLL